MKWVKYKFWSDCLLYATAWLSIISLLVVCDLKIWCKCSLFTRVLDFTGLTGKTLQLIAFDDVSTCLRPVNAPTVA